MSPPSLSAGIVLLALSFAVLSLSWAGERLLRAAPLHQFFHTNKNDQKKLLAGSAPDALAHDNTKHDVPTRGIMSLPPIHTPATQIAPLLLRLLFVCTLVCRTAAAGSIILKAAHPEHPARAQF
jgi:hypothetical protein